MDLSHIHGMSRIIKENEIYFIALSQRLQSIDSINFMVGRERSFFEYTQPDRR